MGGEADYTIARENTSNRGSYIETDTCKYGWIDHRMEITNVMGYREGKGVGEENVEAKRGTIKLTSVSSAAERHHPQLLASFVWESPP